MTIVLFIFKQRTAYGMRISDWSSDVCSSDLSWFMVGVAVEERSSCPRMFALNRVAARAAAALAAFAQKNPGRTRDHSAAFGSVFGGHFQYPFDHLVDARRGFADGLRQHVRRCGDQSMLLVHDDVADFARLMRGAHLRDRLGSLGLGTAKGRSEEHTTE